MVQMVIYAYRFDTDALSTAMPSRMATVLSADECDDFLYLAKVTDDTCDKAEMNQINLTSPTTISNISHHVIVPAGKLGVNAICVVCLLQLFSDHRGICRHKVGVYMG
jgi:hypothetical protein